MKKLIPSDYLNKTLRQCLHVEYCLKEDKVEYYMNAYNKDKGKSLPQSDKDFLKVALARAGRVARNSFKAEKQNLFVNKIGGGQLRDWFLSKGFLVDPHDGAICFGTELEKAIVKTYLEHYVIKDLEELIGLHGVRVKTNAMARTRNLFNFSRAEVKNEDL